MIRLPSILAREAGGQNTFDTTAATLDEALRALPIADLLFDGSGELVTRLVGEQKSKKRTLTDELDRLLKGGAS